MHIAEYFYGSYNNHNARRERKLLLTKKELDKLQRGSTVAERIPADTLARLKALRDGR